MLAFANRRHLRPTQRKAFPHSCPLREFACLYTHLTHTLPTLFPSELDRGRSGEGIGMKKAGWQWRGTRGEKGGEC